MDFEQSEKINPLKKFFREPGLYIKLPTMGNFNEPGEIEFTPTGELAIFPMTAYDELMLKNPDALLNGDAMVQIIRSCVPGIHNPYNITSPDIDVIMMAIRASSYGDEIEYETKCPSCGKENSFNISIRYALDTIKFHQKEYCIKLGKDVEVYLKPRSYATNTKSAILTFEQTKIIQDLQGNAEISQEDKNKIYRESFERMTKFNIEMLADSILGVKIPQGVVTDKDMILEWVQNSKSKDVDKIDKVIDEITNIGLEKEHTVQCEHCQHQWQTSVLFDPSYFFG